ncbi:MAG: TetR-like C-terminal domain-containing protein [Eubacteriales bacterium]
MPPSRKISKDDVLTAAFQIVRKEGIDSLNARYLADALECSTQPIFSCFENMTQLKQAVFQMAGDYHTAYFDKVNTGKNLFVNVGMAYIDFALEEPHLFRLLFMSDLFGAELGAYMQGDCNEHITGAVPERFFSDSPEMKSIFMDMWLYAHGIAALLVTNQITTERDEIKNMLQRVFLLLTKAENKEDDHGHR